VTGLAVEDVPIGQLTRHPRNYNRGNVEELRASLRDHGQWRPAVVQRSTGHVLIGNTMHEAAELEGWQTLAVHWRDVDDETALRILARDNRTRDLAARDDAALLDLLETLDQTPQGLTGSGYADDDRDRMRALLAEEDEIRARVLAENGSGHRRPEPETTPEAPTGHELPDTIDDTPPVPEEDEVVTRVGDVWHLGRHRLWCGDCTTEGAPAALGLTEGVDLILTDPPYCSGGFQESGKAMGSVGTNRKHKQIANDRLSTRGYIALLRAALGRIASPYCYVFTDWRMWVYLFDVVESSGFGVRSMIVGDKGTPGMGRGWRSQHELIMWGARQVPPFDKHAAGIGNVIKWKRTGNPLHTTQKPVDVLVALLDNTPFAATVYDPFGGSGSTLIAAHETGRTCYTAELDPAYCDVTARRFEEHTGEAARLFRDGVEVPEPLGTRQAAPAA
jgi:DNA modification methylase